VGLNAVGTLSLLLALLLTPALTLAVTAHDMRRGATGEPLWRDSDNTTRRRIHRPRFYPKNIAYIRQLPTGLAARARISSPAPPSTGSYENGPCLAGVRRTLLCVRLTTNREDDPFVEALLEPPSKRTILLLDKLGIPAIKDVPPIVFINPDRGAVQLNVFGSP
jgi:hypothetical protein